MGVLLRSGESVNVTPHNLWSFSHQHNDWQHVAFQQDQVLAAVYHLLDAAQIY